MNDAGLPLTEYQVFVGILDIAGIEWTEDPKPGTLCVVRSYHTHRGWTAYFNDEEEFNQLDLQGVFPDRPGCNYTVCRLHEYIAQSQDRADDAHKARVALEVIAAALFHRSIDSGPDRWDAVRIETKEHFLTEASTLVCQAARS